MAKYETMLVTSSALDEEASAALIGKFKSLIEANGTIDSVDDWGKRRLAYPIENQAVYLGIKNGFDGHAQLHHAQVSGQMSAGFGNVGDQKLPDFPAELDRNYRITEGVLRSIIVAEEA